MTCAWDGCLAAWHIFSWDSVLKQMSWRLSLEFAGIIQNSLFHQWWQAVLAKMQQNRPKPWYKPWWCMFHRWDKILKLECSVFFSPNIIASHLNQYILFGFIHPINLSPIVLWLVHMIFSKQFSFWRTVAFFLQLWHAHYGCSVFSWWRAHEH